MPTTDLPADARLVVDFVNTYDVEDNSDALESPGKLVGWLNDRDLVMTVPTSPKPATRADVRRAQALRDRLRQQLIDHHGGKPADAGSTTALADLSRQFPLRLDLEANPPRLVPASDGVTGALSGVVGAVARLAMDGNWDRVKLCPASDCEWAFYDVSKNRSRTWCAMGVCGNRAKTASYRERHRHAPT